MFHWDGTMWTERGLLGFPGANCDLTGKFDIPSAIANQFISPNPAACLSYIAGSWNANWTASSLSVSASSLTGSVFWKTRLDTYASAEFAVVPITTGLADARVTKSNSAAHLAVGTRFVITLTNLLSIKGTVPFPTTWCDQSTYQADRASCPGPSVG